MATIILLYQAVPVMDKKLKNSNYKKSLQHKNEHTNILNQNSSTTCSCHSKSIHTRPELLKKISCSIAGQQIDTRRMITLDREIPRGPHRKQWKSRARRQLEYPDKNVTENVDDNQDAGSVMDHWLGVGRDLRYLADHLTDATQTTVTAQVQRKTGHQDVWSVDFSSASSLFYSLIVLAVLKKLCKMCKLDFLL